MVKRGIYTSDLLSLKDTGTIEREPEKEVRGDWKYVIKGRDAEGKSLAVVFLILDENRILLISAWRPRS